MHNHCGHPVHTQGAKVRDGQDLQHRRGRAGGTVAPTQRYDGEIAVPYVHEEGEAHDNGGCPGMAMGWLWLWLWTELLRVAKFFGGDWLGGRWASVEGWLVAVG